MSKKLGDLVRFVGKNYGPGIKDQWKGLIGMITDTEPFTPQSSSKRHCYTVLVYHPEDSVPYEVLAFEGDLELVNASR